MRWIGESHSPIGLDAGSRFVKAVQIRYVRGQMQIAAMASIQRVSDQLDATEVGRIGEILYRQGFVGTRIRLAVPPAKLLTSILELPPRTADAPFDQLAIAEFARNQKCDMNAFEMACWDLPQPARASKTTNVMAVGCRHTDAEAVLAPFDAVGMDVLNLDTGSCAAARACARVIGGTAGISAILDLGWRSASLVILHGETIVYDRPLGEAGIQPLYKDLSRTLNVEFDVIDALIARHGMLSMDRADANASQKELARAIDHHFATLLKDLELSFTYAANQYGSGGVDRLLLIGGGASIPGLAEHFAKHLGIKVQAIVPTDVAPFADETAKKADSSMISAMGLAMGVRK